MVSSISIIGAPTSAGAYAPGPERAPGAFRRHGLVDTLERSGLVVTDRGDVEGFRWRPDPGRLEAMNLDAVARVAAAVADRVAAVPRDEAVLVLGGDCSVELGTLAGALRGQPSTGLVYIDLDVDLNPPGAGEGALGWMGVAHMLDLDGTAPQLSDLAPRRPMIGSSDILFFGADAITDGEAETIANRELAVIGLEEVKSDPHAAVTQVARWASRFEQILIHLDVDVLSFVDFPIAENTRRQAGLTLPELSASLAGLARLPNWRALTIAQIDPQHAPEEHESFGRLNAMLGECLS